MTVNEQGYLNSPYMSQGYMSGQIQNGLLSQIDMRIVSANDDTDLPVQVEMKTANSDDLRTQIEMRNEFQTNSLPTQIDLRRFVPEILGFQVDQKINDSNATNTQIKIGILPHYICDGYLAGSYLSGPYLSTRLCAQLGGQVEMLRRDKTSLSTQVDQRIVDPTDDEFLSSQVEMKVFEQKSLPMQFSMVTARKLNAQVTMVIYNTTQLRILNNFISRGTENLNGQNWTSVQQIDVGDFSPNNLNTDIVEQRTQTSSTAIWQLRCDTGNPNSFVDTIGILNHNLSRGASVEVSGSDDPAFGTIKFSYPVTVETLNMYYIAPTLPNQSARYYQFTIQDSGNPAGKLSIGTIVFGSAVLMTRKEQFVNPVSTGFRHFKDTLPTEGFTSVSNDRALRKFLNLTYTQLVRDGGNYRALRQYILDSKTDLKSLVIARPSVPSALAVFAKLSQMPEEQHNAIDDNNWYIDMTFDWDESL